MILGPLKVIIGIGELEAIPRRLGSVPFQRVSSRRYAELSGTANRANRKSPD